MGSNFIQEGTKKMAQMVVDYFQKLNKTEKPKFSISNAIWNKTTFVISKIDMILKEKSEMGSIFYELGCTPGKSLSIEHPPKNNWMMIALPEKNRGKEFEGLTSLKNSILKYSSSFCAQHSLNQSIVDSCDLLLREDHQSSILSYIYDKTSYYKSIKANAENRMKEQK